MSCGLTLGSNPRKVRTARPNRQDNALSSLSVTAKHRKVGRKITGEIQEQRGNCKQQDVNVYFNKQDLATWLHGDCSVCKDTKWRCKIVFLLFNEAVSYFAHILNVTPHMQQTVHWQTRLVLCKCGIVRGCDPSPAGFFDKLYFHSLKRFSVAVVLALFVLRVYCRAPRD